MAQELLPQVIVQVLATVSGVVITVGVPIILTKLNKFSRVYTTLFGVQDVESMSGLVGVVEVHDEEIERITDNINSLDSRVAELERSCKSRSDSKSSMND